MYGAAAAPALVPGACGLYRPCPRDCPQVKARMMNRLSKWLLSAALGFTLALPAIAQPVEVRPDGSMAVPAMTIPDSNLMSAEGNQSRVEHILAERAVKGQPVAAFTAALYGPRLERTKAAFPVTIRADMIAGVPVLVYEPKDGIAPEKSDKLLINVHGGGLVACFVECGGMESIPVAALTGIRVVSVDFRLAPAAQFPAASEDVAAVYREVLKKTPPQKIGLYGCSAGGLLAAQSLAWFQSHGLPMPAAAGILCAGADPGMGGDSRIIGKVLGDGENPMPQNGTRSALGYMRDAAETDSNAYPGRFPDVLRRFPPTLVIAGTRDSALSGAVHLHSRLVAMGVDARLHVWEGGRHAFFYDVRVPESREAYDVIARFMLDRLK